MTDVRPISWVTRSLRSRMTRCAIRTIRSFIYLARARERTDDVDSGKLEKARGSSCGTPCLKRLNRRAAIHRKTCFRYKGDVSPLFRAPVRP